MNRVCDNCEYRDLSYEDLPCLYCRPGYAYRYWSARYSPWRWRLLTAVIVVIAIGAALYVLHSSK